MNEPVWIRQDVVVALHEEALLQHGGPEGVRDRGLLESALARPRNLLAYSEQPSPLCGLAAAYARGIVANHPFAPIAAPRGNFLPITIEPVSA